MTNETITPFFLGNVKIDKFWRVVFFLGTLIFCLVQLLREEIRPENAAFWYILTAFFFSAVNNTAQQLMIMIEFFGKKILWILTEITDTRFKLQEFSKHSWKKKIWKFRAVTIVQHQLSDSRNFGRWYPIRPIGDEDNKLLRKDVF